MSPETQAILDHLRTVAAERQLQAQDPALGARVLAIKGYQHRRFERSYADLLAAPATAAAADFFLSDLYGVQDFSARDAQFGRIVPTFERLFPHSIVHTVLELAELHALSETMDRQMGQALERPTVDAAAYVAAWCRVGQPAVRERQITLMKAVGNALVGYTRNPWLRGTLHLMRGPARLARLEALHGFLERGFDTFAGLREPRAFLDTIAARERALAAALFQRPAVPPADLP